MVTGEEAWSVEPEGWFPAGDLFTPEVVDGVVYYGTEIGGFSAVDADTGVEIWSVDPFSKLALWKRGFSFTSPVADGVVYFGLGGTLFAVDAATGEERNRFDAAGHTSSPTVADGVVCVGGGGELHALDVDGWTERWRVDTGDKIWFPTIRDGAVYVPNNGGVFTVLDVESGEKRWQFETGGELHTPPVFTDEAVFFGSHDGTLYDVDRHSGREQWQYAVGEGADFAGVAAAPTVVDDLVYVAVPGLTLVSIDVATGEEQVRLTHG